MLCSGKHLNRLGEHINKTERNMNKTEKLREKHTNINTGYPALDPTAIEYLSGSGWEIMYFVFFSYFVFVSFFNVLV